MTASMQATHEGYISSTHDALIIFECVARGMMPKITRRLREDERKLIRSGQIFIFDEKESGIKRWTDGLLWSPSRILWNFLVYRQVDKKFGTKGPANLEQPSLEGSPQALEGASFVEQTSSSSHGGADPYALGVDPSPSVSNQVGSRNVLTSARSEPVQQTNYPGSALSGPSRLRASSAASESFSSWQANGLVGTENLDYLTGISQRDLDDERNLIGSLRSSYPFAKDGLCKKTISIQMNGTTQHLISYYKVDDVRRGLLRTPSSMPELASLAISPIFLSKASFRFPPTVIWGPDGVARFRGEESGSVRGDGSAESSGEGNSSGSDTRQQQLHLQQQQQQQQQHLPQQGQRNAIYTKQVPLHDGGTRFSPLGNAVMGTRNITSANSNPSSSSRAGLRQQPMSHQIGGTGFYKPSRRSSDAALRNSRNRFDPYTVTIPTANHRSGNDSSVSTSPNSMPATPYFTSNLTGLGAYEGVADQTHQLSPVRFAFQYPQQVESRVEGGGGESANIEGHNDQSRLDQRVRASGMAVSSGEFIPYYRDEEFIGTPADFNVHDPNLHQSRGTGEGAFDDSQSGQTWTQSNEGPMQSIDSIAAFDGEQRLHNPAMLPFHQQQQQQQHHQTIKSPSPQRIQWSVQSDQSASSAAHPYHLHPPQPSSHPSSYAVPLTQPQEEQFRQQQQQQQQQRQGQGQYSHLQAGPLPQHQNTATWANTLSQMPPPPPSMPLDTTNAMPQSYMQQQNQKQHHHYSPSSQHQQHHPFQQSQQQQAYDRSSQLWAPLTERSSSSDGHLASQTQPPVKFNEEGAIDNVF
ncbi:hypothetical protein CBS101457_002466 [Exobasidium rhododendri]|nr:hypothetical protein CBS101457_002466 [Exobasidium rhododendri]